MGKREEGAGNACLVRRVASRWASRQALLRGLWRARNVGCFGQNGWFTLQHTAMLRESLSGTGELGRTVRGDLPSRDSPHNPINLYPADKGLNRARICDQTHSFMKLSRIQCHSGVLAAEASR